MPRHTEEEEEKKRKLPLLARLGRSFGRSSADARVRVEALNRGAEERGVQFSDVVSSVKTGGRQIAEGFRAGNQGREIDTEAFNKPDVAPSLANTGSGIVPVGGGSGTATRPPKNFSPGAPLAADFQEFTGDEVVAIGDPSPFVPDTNIEAPRPPPRPPGSPDVATEAGQFEGGVPEGFINVIRGTRSSFLRVDEQGRVGDRNTEFSAVPGQTLAESEQVGARRDPAFNVLTNADLAQQRVTNEGVQAEAQRLNSIFSNAETGFNSEGKLVLTVPNASGGFDEIEDFTPFLDSLIDGQGNFSISRVPGAGGIFESAVVLNEDDGTTRNITNEQFLGKAFTEFNNRVTRKGKNLTREERLEILEEIEELMGAVPEIEAAILAGQ